MPHGVTDEVFGKIRWSEDKWETTASFEYFRGSGERVPLTEKDRESMPPVDRLEMDIQTGEKRRKPDERQREAWKKILGRGDALWEEALDAMIEEYRRQWPLRARYWRVSGELGLMDRMLPERVDRETMWQMVVPLSCTLEWPDAQNGAVDFFLVFIVTWYSEPLSVYVRDGRVSDVVPMSVFMSRRGPHIAPPAFGTIYRGKGDAMPWAGDVEIAPFNSWAAVAVDRGQWEERSKRSDERSPLPWDLARGWSSLLVYCPKNKPPTAKQEAALVEATSPSAIDHIIRAVFDHYREVAEERRRTYKGRNRDLAVPRLRGPEGLADITELRTVEVFPEEERKPVAVGFEFFGSWTGCAGFMGYDGCGVRWRGGRIERIGDPRVANPNLYERLETPGT